MNKNQSAAFTIEKYMQTLAVQIGTFLRDNTSINDIQIITHTHNK